MVRFQKILPLFSLFDISDEDLHVRNPHHGAKMSLEDWRALQSGKKVLENCQVEPAGVWEGPCRSNELEMLVPFAQKLSEVLERKVFRGQMPRRAQAAVRWLASICGAGIVCFLFVFWLLVVSSTVAKASD